MCTIQEELPTFVVIGAAGDGKSSIIGSLLSPGSSSPPATGRNPNGVTKMIESFPIKCFDEDMWLLDTMGIGDSDKGIGSLIAGLRCSLEGNGQQHVDGLIVTCPIATGRLGLACQIVQEIIRHSLVSDSNKDGPWERVIVCGTQRDRCDEDELEEFRKTGAFFFEGLGVVEPGPANWQITTCSIKQEEGMNDLMKSMQSLREEGEGGEVMWDPKFDETNGAQRLAAGVCQKTNGDADLVRLELEIQFAWTQVVKMEKQGDLVESGGKVTTQAAQGLLDIPSHVAGSVGKDVVEQYTAQQLATGTGSGMLKSGVAITESNSVVIGKGMLETASKNGGNAGIKSSSGNIVGNLATHVSVVKGIEAGVSAPAVIAGVGSELIAGQFEASKRYKKPIGFFAQVGTAGACGCMAGGPIGGAVGAFSSAVIWASSEIVGQGVEKLITDSRGEENPTVLKYYEAKARYDEALAKKSKED